MGRILFLGLLEEVGDLGIKNFFMFMVISVKGCEELKLVFSFSLLCLLFCSYLKYKI